jgi:hypothetical protein
MQILRGLVFASALLCAGGAQAFQLNVHMPTIHQLNPQPLPPGYANGSGWGAGKATLSDSASPKLNSTGMVLHNGTHIPK